MEPKDLRNQFEVEDLPASLRRAETIHRRRGQRERAGTLAPALGVVELTVALHYVFNTPEDQIVWDVGHQAYGHKILTGRRDQFHTNRIHKGLSGFPKRSESPL